MRLRYPLAGQVVLVADTVARKAETAALLKQGAAVIGLDSDAVVKLLHGHPAFLGLACEPADRAAIKAALELGVRTFGGIDGLVGGDAPLRETCRPLLALSPVITSGKPGLR